MSDASETRLATASELAELLARDVDNLTATLMPAAKRSGSYWQAGNVQGDPGNSLYIHRAGAKVGKWTDAATGEFGDLLDLINHVLYGAQDLRASIRWASDYLRLDSSRPAPTVPDRAARPKPHQHDGDEAAISAARGIWVCCQPGPDTLAERYLRWRAITLPCPVSLRYHAALPYYATGAALPALVAGISGPGGRVTAIQRIYLRLDGLGKAGVSEPKLTLGRLNDGAVRLAPAGRELGLSEGVETGLSAMELYRIPVWAACGSRMDAIAVPEAVEQLTIFADNGAAGISAAERATVAHERPGRDIAIVFPPAPHKDWNDLARHDAGMVAA